MEKFDVNNTIGSPAVSAGISGITISGSVLPRVLEITKPDIEDDRLFKMGKSLCPSVG